MFASADAEVRGAGAAACGGEARTVVRGVAVGER